MLYYPISALINAITTIVLGTIVITRNPRSALNRSFCYFSSCVAFWSFGYFLWQISNDENHALFWCRALMAGSIFIPSTFFHFSVTLIGQYKKYFRETLFVYAGSVFFFMINFTSLFVKEVRPQLSFPYWPMAGIMFAPFFAMFVGVIIYAHMLMYKHYRSLSGLKRNQIKYIFLGTAIAFLGGSTNFPLWYGIPIPPVGNILVSVYVFLLAYSIIRYRLMDIKMAITRGGIFLCVYIPVLGIPFGLGLKFLGTGLWLLPVSIMAVLAAVGPFIYLYIQRMTEAAILQEQRQYQMTLQQASLGMGQIKELGRLLKLIVHIVTRAVGIEHTKIYLLHEDSGQFTLKASRGWPAGSSGRVSVLVPDSPLVRRLKETREPVVGEAMRQDAQDDGDTEDGRIQNMVRKLDGALVVPSFMDQKLIAILVLGRKKSGKLYTQDDLAVFSILANQAALAIENAQFYEKMKETHKQLLRAEKMATVGTMADGLSHQINNRLHAMGFIAGDALDTIKLKKRENLSPDIQALLDDIGHSLNRIEDNVKRGGEIVDGLLKYTRKGSEGFGPIDLNALLDAALEMVRFKIKLDEMNIVRNFNGRLPNIKGNFTQLQEVFFNIIDNAYDAMMQRKTELKEAGYRARLEISAGRKDHALEVLIRDNGIGVKTESLEKLFMPFFTTKLYSRKGTGLGLYVIRHIIEENHGGKVEFASDYRQGSQIRMVLPIEA